MHRVQLDGVGKRYGDHTVLRDVTLALDPGDLLLVQGPSGSGKTTLLQLLGLLEPPTEGRLLLDGHDTTRLDDDARARLRLARIGHVFQAHNMIPTLTLEENVLLPMRLARRPDRRRARDLLARLGLADKADSLPGHVSLGQRQRAAIARALANHPTLLLADEPTASLDDDNAHLVTTTLHELANQGATIVVASHDARLRRDGGKTRRLELVPAAPA